MFFSQPVHTKDYTVCTHADTNRIRFWLLWYFMRYKHAWYTRLGDLPFFGRCSDTAKIYPNRENYTATQPLIVRWRRIGTNDNRAAAATTTVVLYKYKYFFLLPILGKLKPLLRNWMWRKHGKHFNFRRCFLSIMQMFAVHYAICALYTCAVGSGWEWLMMAVCIVSWHIL